MNEIGTTVSAQYYSGLIDPAGQYVTVNRNGRRVSVRLANRNWHSEPKIDLYLTPERHVGIKAADSRWFIVDPMTMKVAVSALPYTASWTYVGSFDFAGSHKRGNLEFIHSKPTQ